MGSAGIYMGSAGIYMLAPPNTLYIHYCPSQIIPPPYFDDQVHRYVYDVPWEVSWSFDPQ